VFDLKSTKLRFNIDGTYFFELWSNILEESKNTACEADIASTWKPWL
jgi:hypothetical protein